MSLLESIGGDISSMPLEEALDRVGQQFAEWRTKAMDLLRRIERFEGTLGGPVTVAQRTQYRNLFEEYEWVAQTANYVHICMDRLIRFRLRDDPRQAQRVHAARETVFETVGELRAMLTEIYRVHGVY